MVNPSAKAINLAMEELKRELDIITPTERHNIQQRYSDIIVDYSKADAGRVKTYTEVVKERQAFAQKHGQEYREYTQKEYKQQLRKLVKELGDVSVSGAQQDYRDRVRNLIDAYNDYTGSTIDIDTIPFEDLKEVVDAATQEMGKRSKDRTDSPKMFTIMSHYFRELGYRGYSDSGDDSMEMMYQNMQNGETDLTSPDFTQTLYNKFG